MPVLEVEPIGSNIEYTVCPKSRVEIKMNENSFFDIMVSKFWLFFAFAFFFLLTWLGESNDQSNEDSIESVKQLLQ